ncbi:MAG TPA: hypothetical protein VK563_23445 [Puia sp.]|nr:hypothetical protein [Puia sp.]
MKRTDTITILESRIIAMMGTTTAMAGIAIATGLGITITRWISKR